MKYSQLNADSEAGVQLIRSKNIFKRICHLSSKIIDIGPHPKDEDQCRFLGPMQK